MVSWKKDWYSKCMYLYLNHSKGNDFPKCWIIAKKVRRGKKNGETKSMSFVEEEFGEVVH